MLKRLNNNNKTHLTQNVMAGKIFQRSEKDEGFPRQGKAEGSV